MKTGNTFILGINSAYHESSAAILKDGELLAFVEEERFNRIKHAKPAKVDNPDLLPWSAIDFCLKTAKIQLNTVDYFAYSFSPEARLAHNVDLVNEQELIKNSWGTKKGESSFHRKILTIPNQISKKSGSDVSEKFIFVPHHIAHAASSYYPSNFKKAALLVVDGIAEFATAWTGQIEGHHITKIDEIVYPNSLGFLWEKFSEYLGFSEYDAAKVMGLSAYGEAYKFREHFDKIIQGNNKGSFTVNNRYLKFRTGKFDGLEKLFKEKKRPSDKHIFAIHENIAATLQERTEEILIDLAQNLYSKTKLDNLCYSGGLGLNCVANTKIFGKSRFKNIYIHPAANDAGTALGAGYYVWHNVLKAKRCKAVTHAYWGPEYSNREIEEILKGSNLIYRKVRAIEKVVANLLSKGHIIGWFQGRMETGPRALGNRSILADPRSPVIRDDLNRKVKFREIFRPLCPSVLSEEVSDWFQIGKGSLSPMDYMLMAIKIKPGKEKILPAIVHVDNTCRVQTVTKSTNPKFHNLIKEFKKITGIPIILNTSFNIREPIVCSPQDAVNTFRRSKIDCLAIGDYLVEHPQT